MVLMNIEKLEINKEYTWKEICELVGIKYRTGKGQITDLKKLKELAEVVEVGKGKGKRYIIKSFLSPKVPQKKVNIFTNTINENLGNFVGERKTADTFDYDKTDWDLINLVDYVNTVSPFIPNFKKLCELLKIKYTKNDKTRAKILDHLEHFINFQRNVNKKGMKGSGFLVRDIISIDYEQIIKQGKYDECITDLMINHYIDIKNKNCEEYLYKHDIFQLLDFCSSEYREYINNQSTLAKEMNLNPLQIEDYYNTSFKRMNEIMTRALTKMHKRGLLSGFYQTYQVLTYDEDEEEEIYRPATKDERQYIQFCIQKALVEFNNPEVHLKGFGNQEMKIRQYKRFTVNDIPKHLLEDFNSYVLTLVNKKFTNISKYYSCHAIEFNPYTCEYFIKNKLIDTESNNTNDIICNALLKTFERNHNKAVNRKTVKRYEKYNDVRLNLEGYIDLVDKLNKVV